MDLRRLGHFLAVAEYGGFTAAARAVHVSQPALSLAVRELEAELGTSLFVRLGRGVRLTPAGEALVGPARQVQRDLATGQAAVASVVGLVAGSLSLACLPTLATDPMARLVGEFRRRHPGVRIDLAAPEDGEELAALVATGACELGVTEAGGPDEALVSRPLGDQQLVLLLPPGSDPPDPEDRAATNLPDVPFVAGPPGTSSRRLLDEALAAVGRAPDLAVVTAQRDAIIPLVLAGAGAALVPEAQAAVAARLGAVVVSPVPPVTRALALVHRPGPLAPAAARFCELALA